MAGNLTIKYGSSNQTVTITVASLTNTSARQSTVIDNTSTLYQDVLVFFKIKSAASGTATTGSVNVYVVATTDGGTTYTENAGASDAAITLSSPPNARQIGFINMVANATTYYGGPFSVASGFGGSLPDHFAIVIENRTGGTLDTTAGNHSVTYQGVENAYT